MRLTKKNKTTEGLGITLKSNQVKDIMKVVAIERNYCKCCKSKKIIPWFTTESWSTI